jgi:uncharacterized protein with ATP-grasp and redox domains
VARGKSLPQETIDGVKKMYEQEPNKNKLARMFGISRRSVFNILGKVDPDEQRERRQEAMGRMADTMAARVEDLLDSVKKIPEKASYQQRMVAIGILTDKIDRIDKRLEESKREDAIAALPMPETVEAMAAALRSEIRQVNFILNLTPEGGRMIEEARRLEAQIGTPIVDAEVIDSISDLDGAK